MSPYLHTLDGRLRIRVPEVKRSPRRARALELELGVLSPIAEVTANPVTGNVLVLYDSERTTATKIVEALWAVGYLRGGFAAVGPSPGGAVDWGTVVLRATTELALQALITALI